VDAVLRRLAAMRSYMREINMGRPADESLAAAVGMTGVEIQDMFRLLAIAKYDERYVIPPAHAEQAHALEELASECSLDFEGGPGAGGSGPFGEGSGGPTPIAVENFQMLQERQTSDTVVETDPRRGRTNLLNWDGRGKPQGLFPKGHASPKPESAQPNSPPSDGPQSDSPPPDSPQSDSPEGRS
jgi:nitrate reductase beta subunit